MLIVDTVSTCEFKSEVTYWQSAAAQNLKKKKKNPSCARVISDHAQMFLPWVADP